MLIAELFGIPTWALLLVLAALMWASRLTTRSHGVLGVLCLAFGIVCAIGESGEGKAHWYIAHFIPVPWAFIGMGSVILLGSLFELKPDSTDNTGQVPTENDALREDKFYDYFFPRGNKDMDAGATELRHILNQKLNHDTARAIFTDVLLYFSNQQSESSDHVINLTKLYLLEKYPDHFDEAQTRTFVAYLSKLLVARTLHQKSPSQVWRDGDDYVW